MARISILRRVRTENAWRNLPLGRSPKGRIKWVATAPYLIEWRKAGRRRREAAGTTPAEAIEAQKRKRFELEAKARGLTIEEPVETETAIPLMPPGASAAPGLPRPAWRNTCGLRWLAQELSPIPAALDEPRHHQLALAL